MGARNISPAAAKVAPASWRGPFHISGLIGSGVTMSGGGTAATGVEAPVFPDVELESAEDVPDDPEVSPPLVLSLTTPGLDAVGPGAITTLGLFSSGDGVS